MAKLDDGPPGPGEAFVHVGDFLRETDASPALGERMTDAEGVVVESDAYRRAVIVDHIPGTGPAKLGPACAADHTGYPHSLPGGAQLQNGAPITHH
jgi:hypothetical protein